MNRSRTAVLQMILPLLVVTLACSLFSSPVDQPVEKASSPPSLVQVSETPRATITDVPTLTATQLIAIDTALPTKKQPMVEIEQPTTTQLPPALDITPEPAPDSPGIEIIPAMEAENTGTELDTTPAVDIKTEIFFAGAAGGEGGLSCTLAEDWAFPAVGDGGWGWSDDRSICFLGFPLDQPIFISLYAPNGNHINI